MENYIIQCTHLIYLKKGSLNIYGNINISNDINISSEFKFLVKYIDNDMDHINTLNKGDSRKDRYSNIKSYSHNIVTINKEQNYINASPINIINRKYFITTQGPKKETIEDFWEMVWEHNSNIIVMLCNEIEGGKEKCARYWDDNKYKKFNIHIEKENNNNKYIYRKIKLINIEEKKDKIVDQIHFIIWPDHGVPNTQDGNIFDVFCEIFRLVDQIRREDPIVVHCSAGVGRTGTFIAMYYLEKEIKIQIKNKYDEIKFSIFNLVRKLKEMRLYLVQNSSQYKFIYEFARHLLQKYNI